MKCGITIGGLASAIALSGLFLTPAALWSFRVAPPRTTPATPPPSLSVIQGMSELATTRVHISDVVEGENRHWRGKWLLHGEVILGVDLAAARYVASNSDTREAVLRLPPPHLIASKVDHEHSEELSMKSLSWVGFSNPNLLRDDVWKHADRKLQQLGQEPGYAEQAKVRAERVLQDLFGGVGWKVRFEWE